MRKRLLCTSLCGGVLLLSALLAGCGAPTAASPAAAASRPVTVQTVQEQTLPVTLSYWGQVSAGKLTKYSFKQPGKITRVNVHKGDKVKPGDILAVLDPKDVSLAARNADLNLAKAKAALDNARDQYAKLQALFAAGALSKNDLDKAKLDLDIKEETYNQALIDVEAKQSALADTKLAADSAGYVADIMFAEGEVVAAGYPVVAVRQGEPVITVGLSAQDLAKVRVGTKATVTLDGGEGTGEITAIDQIPDPSSRTYTAEIKLTQAIPSQAFYLGAPAKVALAAGEDKGVWIPIAAVLNDGEDYVFVIDAGRAVKKNIRLIDSQGFAVKVEGLNPGEELVTAGMRELEEGTPVTRQEGAGK